MTKTTVLLTVALGLLLNIALRAKGSAIDQSEGKIVGGVQASKAYPFFAYGKGCAATVIHEDVLLTAAHCQGYFSNGVTVGTSSLSSNEGEKRSVTRELVHPRFNKKTIENDLMLLQLDRPITMQPISYSRKALAPRVGITLTVIGFGATVYGGAMSPILREAQVTTVDSRTCAVNYADFGGNEKFVRTTMFCAQRNGADACQGDSGGAIINRSGIQVGIVSWGKGCGDPRYPGVYTRIGAFSRWIQSGVCQLARNPPEGC